MLARTLQCLLLLGTRVFQQANRNTTGLLLVFMSGDEPISMSQKGRILSAVAVGYFLTQVPGGVLADRVGAKNVITCALTMSALCILAVPLCFDNFGTAGLCLVLALMGAVQGPLFPTSTVFLSRWMPATEKAWGSSMLDIGISVGTLLIIPTANSLAESIGWRGAYHAIGLASLGFVAVWQALASEEPQRSRISKEELQHLQQHVPVLKKEGHTMMPAELLLHPALWAIFGAHIAFNFGGYFLTNWSPTYYSEVLLMAPAAARLHLALPHATNLVCKGANPILERELQRRGFGLLASRRIFTAVGFAGAAAMLLPVYSVHGLSPWFSTGLFCMANAFFGLAPCGFKSNYLDVTRVYVGAVSGYGNTLGTVASWVGPQLVAFILACGGSWQLVHVTVVLANGLAAYNFWLHSIVTPIEESAPTSCTKAGCEGNASTMERKGSGSGEKDKDAMQMMDSGSGDGDHHALRRRNGNSSVKGGG